MKALSIRQPYAELILSGRKRYELRSWSTKERGRVLVHASSTITPEEREAAQQAGLDLKSLERGAVLGSVEIIGCGPFTPEMAEEMRAKGAYSGEWEPGTYAFTLQNPRRFRTPIPLKGRLGFFEIPDDRVAEEASG